MTPSPTLTTTLSAQLGPLAAFLSAVTWAVGSATYGKLARTYPASAINSTRALFAFPVFLAVTLLVPQYREFLFTLSLDSPLIGWSAASIIASYAVGDFLFLLATVQLGISGTLAIASCYPLWSTLAGAVIRGEPLTTTNLLGVLLVIIGTVLVILSAPHTTQKTKRISRQTALGFLLAIFTSIFWAANVVTVAQATSHGPVPIITTFRMGFALLLCPLVAALTSPLTKQKIRPFFISPAHMKICAPAILLECLGGSTLYTYGLQHSSLAVASALSALAPVLAVPVSLWLGLEKFSFYRTLGVVTAVAGALTLSL